MAFTPRSSHLVSPHRFSLQPPLELPAGRRDVLPLAGPANGDDIAVKQVALKGFDGRIVRRPESRAGMLVEPDQVDLGLDPVQQLDQALGIVRSNR